MNKTIDLTPIVGAQVLCEFWNDDHDYCLSMLVDIQDDGTFVAYSNSERGKEFTNCRIYHHLDYWISNADGKLVLPDGLMVKLKYKCQNSQDDVDGLHAVSTTDSDNGEQYFIQEMPEDFYESTSNVDYSDIIAVQVTGVADGYQWGA
jgi:hypothetical protein